jgi:hypothetical protein
MSFSLFGTGSSYQARSKDLYYIPRSYQEIQEEQWLLAKTHFAKYTTSMLVLYDANDYTDPGDWPIRVTLKEFQSVHSAKEYNDLLERNYIRDYCTRSPSLCDWVSGFFGYNKKNV